MDVRVGDILHMKKPHPCGSTAFTVLRAGMDFKIRCCGCGREVMLPRLKCEKNIKRIERHFICFAFSSRKRGVFPCPAGRGIHGKFFLLFPAEILFRNAKR